MGTRKIAFVSCAYATHRPHQPAWTAIRAADPDLLLMLGDTAYLDWAGEGRSDVQGEERWNFAALDDCYRAQFEGQGDGLADFRALIASTPTMAVWDDHDCGPNDTMGADAPDANLAHTRALFNRWMGFARNNNPDGHMYCTWEDFPELRVLMLDGRTWRTRSSAANATLLGDVQEGWLRDRLTLDPQRRITIVATGSAFGKGAHPGGYDVSDYSRFADDLQDMLAFRAGGGTDPGRRALFLGGDIHENRFVSHGRGWHEAISSGVACFAKGTKAWPSQTLTHRFTDNWGLITVTDTQVHIDLHERRNNQDEHRRKTIDIATWRVVAG